MKAKRKERKQNVNDYLCGYCRAVLKGKWLATYKSCTCDCPQPKSTFLVKGQDGSVYSTGSVKRCAEYIFDNKDLFSEDLISSPAFLHPVRYEDRDHEKFHSFEVDFKKGFTATKGQRCKTADVLTAEIHINIHCS